MDNKSNSFEGFYQSRRKVDVNSTASNSNKQMYNAAAVIDKKKRPNRNQVSSTGNINKKNDSIPLILPRPKVVEKQIRLKKTKQDVFEYEHENDVRQSKITSDYKRVDDINKKELSEDDLVNRKEIISSMMNQISLMLEESFPNHEKDTELCEQYSSLIDQFLLESKEYSLLEDKFLSMLEESFPNQDKYHMIPEQSSSLIDQFLLESKEFSLLEDAILSELVERMEGEEKSELYQEGNGLVEGDFSETIEEGSFRLEESKSMKEESSLEKKIHSMLKEDISDQEVPEIIKEKDSSIEEEFSEEHEGRAIECDESHSNKKEDKSLVEKFSSILEETSELNKFESPKEGDTSHEVNLHDDTSRLNRFDSLVEKFSLMLENSTLDDDSSEEEYFTDEYEIELLTEEVEEQGYSTCQDEYEIELLTEEEEEQGHSTCQDEYEVELLTEEEEEQEYSACQDEYDIELLTEEEEEQEYSTCQDVDEAEPLTEEEEKKECCNKLQKHHLPIVKLPVLLANFKIDFDIYDHFELPVSITKITEIDWSLDKLNCHVLLPSTTVFLKGILIADIQYVNENIKHTLHSVKISIPLEKFISLDWLHPPVLSSSNKREFMFESQIDQEVSSHYEFTQQFADQIYHELRCINFIWHEELANCVENQKLFIQGSANLKIDLLQPQFIDLSSACNHL